VTSNKEANIRSIADLIVEQDPVAVLESLTVLLETARGKTGSGRGVGS